MLAGSFAPGEGGDSLLEHGVAAAAQQHADFEAFSRIGRGHRAGAFQRSAFAACESDVCHGVVSGTSARVQDDECPPGRRCGGQSRANAGCTGSSLDRLIVLDHHAL